MDQFGKQCLVRCHLKRPLPAVESGEKALAVSRAQGWSQGGFFRIFSGTSPKLDPKSSCRGKRTPLRRKRRLIGS
jgi:hypothetical protein